MSLVRGAWAVLLVVGVVLGLVGLLRPGPVDATNHSASRQFSQPWVPPGGELTVKITASGYGALGQIVETLPPGFSYVSSGPQVVGVVEGQIVTFTLLGDKSVTYTVTAPTEEGVYAFAGVLKDSEKVERQVGGISQVTVSATPPPTPTPTPAPTEPMATRYFSEPWVLLGGELVITITAVRYGDSGQVLETLPAGFSYVSSSLQSTAMVEGQTITFTLAGEETFTYTVIAPAASTSEGAHPFAGVLHDSDMGQQPVVGHSSITVRATPPPTPRPATPQYKANRSFSEPWVSPGTELTVTITAAGYGGLGQVVETLPAGFSYVSSSLPDASVVEGRTVIFTLLGNDAFTYTVTASVEEGAYSFDGVLRDSDKVEQPVGGSSELTVSATPPSDADTHTHANTCTSRNSHSHTDGSGNSHPCTHASGNSHPCTHANSRSDPHACANTYRDVDPIAHADHRARTGVDLKQNACALIAASACTHSLTDGDASEHSDAGARQGLRDQQGAHTNSDGGYRAVHPRNRVRGSA